MLKGAGLVKLDYQLDEQNTAFAGAGFMPNFFRSEIGTNERRPSPTSVFFAGLDGRHETGWQLSSATRLDLRNHTFALLTVGRNQETGEADKAVSQGLSKATMTNEATLSHRFGPVTGSLTYGNHVDLGMTRAYYATGGEGLFPQTHYVQADLAGTLEAARFHAAAYIPLSTATSDFAPDPKVMAAVAAPHAPDMSVVAGAHGVESITTSKSWDLGHSWDATAGVRVERPFDGKREVQAFLGVRYNFGEKQPAQPLPFAPAFPAPMPPTARNGGWRSEEAPRTAGAGQVPYSQPKLSDYFSQQEIAAMRGKPVEELARYLKTPEAVTAYLSANVRYDYGRMNDSNADIGSLTPNQVAALLKGVCRDQHSFVVEVMKEGAGIEGKQVGYAAPGTSHSIAVYADPRSGKWNVIEYGRLYHTEAATPEEAFARLRPDALTSSDWSQKGPNGANFVTNIRYSETAREFYRFVTPQ